jgi:hypothetical protein
MPVMTSIQPEHLDRILPDLGIQADWIGLRWVKETEHSRYMRDGFPRSKDSW